MDASSIGRTLGIYSDHKISIFPHSLHQTRRCYSKRQMFSITKRGTPECWCDFERRFHRDECPTMLSLFLCVYFLVWNMDVCMPLCVLLSPGVISLKPSVPFPIFFNTEFLIGLGFLILLYKSQVYASSYLPSLGSEVYTTMTEFLFCLCGAFVCLVFSDQI